MSILDRLPPPQAADESTVAVVSHLLLNALSVIVGSASTLRDHPSIDVDKREDLLETIEHHGYLAARLVETLARGHHGDLDLLYAVGARAGRG
jgi:signal transduction histidine kinase